MASQLLNIKQPKISVMEIRFVRKNKISKDEIFQTTYPKVYHKHPKLKDLGIEQDEREFDENNLKYHPDYAFESNSSVIAVGPQIISISAKDTTWEDFSKLVRETLSSIFVENEIEKVSRLGVRFVEFFPNAEIKDVKGISLSTTSSGYTKENELIRVKLVKDSLRIHFNLAWNSKAGEDGHGIATDIDVNGTDFETSDVTLDRIYEKLNERRVQYSDVLSNFF